LHTKENAGMGDEKLQASHQGKDIVLAMRIHSYRWHAAADVGVKYLYHLLYI